MCDRDMKTDAASQQQEAGAQGARIGPRAPARPHGGTPTSRRLQEGRLGRSQVGGADTTEGREEDSDEIHV